MENIEKNEQQAAEEIYEYAARMMLKERKTAYETKMILIDGGLDNATASDLVAQIEEQIQAIKKGANRDMLFGALWCAGGLFFTLADLGYIFWGAILFGAIQFIRGMSNSM